LDEKKDSEICNFKRYKDMLQFFFFDSVRLQNLRAGFSFFSSFTKPLAVSEQLNWRPPFLFSASFIFGSMHGLLIFGGKKQDLFYFFYYYHQRQARRGGVELDVHRKLFRQAF
jgi:hypothetical protein